jgi:hypothetical protein
LPLLRDFKKIDKFNNFSLYEGKLLNDKDSPVFLNLKQFIQTFFDENTISSNQYDHLKKDSFYDSFFKGNISPSDIFERYLRFIIFVFILLLIYFLSLPKKSYQIDVNVTGLNEIGRKF